MSSVANATIISPGEAKSNAIVAYTLIGIGLFTAIPIFIGAIWAMIKRSSAMGTIYHSHYTNAIRTFWWGLFWWIIGGLLTIIMVGWIVIGAVWLWTLYRIINGFGKILADEAYPI